MAFQINRLWFDYGEAREAAELYASVFPDSEIGRACCRLRTFRTAAKKAKS